ncbi:DUF899 family protein [Actinomycetospora termitidis]|uniref:DUF899 family protein n=1 Tax=Actinomycetospora termitidis TaxID=3053470 RepID=A0ABT7M1C6_9PSEU|nr:DUF899 family protein [Actinomycetospora sp. Odt1-22]MDL5154460.1 DUF899 family protein [Actinomycetospora sp. Odt1-22]
MTPDIAGRDAFESAVDALRPREKAHTREGDAIAAARRRLPMVEVDPATPLVGKDGPTTLLDAFEGRTQLVAYYFMWHDGHPAAEQCEGCTWDTSQIGELSYLHSRDITYATFCQGPYDESRRYRDFLGWDVPWYSAQESLGTLLAPPKQVGLMHLVCYLRRGDRVFETYWTTRRGVEAMDNSYALMDLTVYGRQEPWEDSPSGWPASCSYTRTADGPPTWTPVAEWPEGRPIPQWPRLDAGHSDDLAHPATGDLSCSQTIYVHSTPEEIWLALTDAEATAAWWGRSNVSDWEVGSRWEHRKPSGELDGTGEVLVSDRPRRLVLTFPSGPPSRVAFEVDPYEEIARLTVTHSDLASEPLRAIVAGVWAAVLSNLKTYLETGTTLPRSPVEMLGL